MALVKAVCTVLDAACELIPHEDVKKACKTGVDAVEVVGAAVTQDYVTIAAKTVESVAMMTEGATADVLGGAATVLSVADGAGDVAVKSLGSAATSLSESAVDGAASTFGGAGVGATAGSLGGTTQPAGIAADSARDAVVDGAASSAVDVVECAGDSAAHRARDAAVDAATRARWTAAARVIAGSAAGVGAGAVAAVATSDAAWMKDGALMGARAGSGGLRSAARSVGGSAVGGLAAAAATSGTTDGDASVRADSIRFGLSAGQGAGDSLRFDGGPPQGRAWSREAAAAAGGLVSTAGAKGPRERLARARLAHQSARFAADTGLGIETSVRYLSADGPAGESSEQDDAALSVRRLLKEVMKAGDGTLRAIAGPARLAASRAEDAAAGARDTDLTGAPDPTEPEGRAEDARHRSRMRDRQQVSDRLNRYAALSGAIGDLVPWNASQDD